MLVSNTVSDIYHQVSFSENFGLIDKKLVTRNLDFRKKSYNDLKKELCSDYFSDDNDGMQDFNLY